MKRKIIPIGIAGIFAAIFLILVLFSNGCEFNLLPYLIHMSVSNDGAGDNSFIRVFDLLFGGLIFILIYWIVRRIVEDKSK